MLNYQGGETFPLIDSLVYTEREIIDLINKKESFIFSAIKESILLYSKTFEQNLNELNSPTFDKKKSKFYDLVNKIGNGCKLIN